MNYLRPDIKRGNISADEEELIIRLHKLLGNRWSLIAGRLPGRTDNEIKNYWNTNLGKRVQHHQHSSITASKHDKSNARIMKKGNQVAQKAPTASTSSHVVRTKATRCSKVFINPHQCPQKVDPFDWNRGAKPNSTDGDCSMNPTSASAPINGLYIPEKDHTFPLDFNMGEFCLSDLLNFEFSDLGDLDYSNASPPSNQALIFSEGMLHDSTSSHYAQQNVGPNLHSLTPSLPE